MKFGDSPLKSAIIVVSLRWIDRLIGFVSTLILARLLMPEDFGLIAMASIIIGLAEAMLDVGVNVFLIQARNPTSAHYNTGWTVRVIQGFFLFLLLSSVSPFVAQYFGDERVQLVLIGLAFSGWVATFENVGVVNFQREMRFSQEFRYLFTRRIFGFFVTIGLALTLRSYFALVIGTIMMRLFGVTLSFWMHPMRPRWSLEKVSEMMGVSVFLMLKNIFMYVDGNFHKVVLGGGTSTASMGGYTVACEVADLPSSEILSPINRVLFPMLTRARDDINEQLRIMNLTQGIHLLITIPVSIGLCLLADETVRILLGEKWVFVVNALQIVAFFNITSSVISAPNYLMMANGFFKVVMWISFVQLCLFGFTFSFSPWPITMENVASIRLVCLGLGTIFGYYIFKKLIPQAQIKDLFANSIRPVLGSVVMAGFIVYFVFDVISDRDEVSRFMITALTGALVYGVTVVLLWLLQSRPAGPEMYVFERLKERFNK